MPVTREAWIRYWRAKSTALAFDANCLRVMKLTPARQCHIQVLDHQRVICEGALAACEEGTYQPPASFRGPFASFDL